MQIKPCSHEFRLGIRSAESRRYHHQHHHHDHLPLVTLTTPLADCNCVNYARSTYMPLSNKPHTATPMPSSGNFSPCTSKCQMTTMMRAPGFVPLRRPSLGRYRTHRRKRRTLAQAQGFSKKVAKKRTGKKQGSDSSGSMEPVGRHIHGDRSQNQGSGRHETWKLGRSTYSVF